MLRHDTPKVEGGTEGQEIAQVWGAVWKAAIEENSKMQIPHRDRREGMWGEHMEPEMPDRVSAFLNVLWPAYWEKAHPTFIIFPSIRGHVQSSQTEL